MENEIIVTASGEQPLSVRETKRLDELEAVIEANFRGFYAVGKALMEIWDTRLFRQDYGTFEAYLKQFWDMGKAHAYRLIDASRVIDTIQMYSDPEDGLNQKVSNWRQNEAEMPQNPTLIPINEAQARELAKLPPEDQVTAWQRAVETAPDGKITARHIRACVRKIKENEIQKRTRKIREYTAPDKRVSDEFDKAFDLLLSEINKEMLNDWKHTSRAAALIRVKFLHSLVRDGIQVMEFEDD